MADQSELRMNLAAIKRVDPYAKEILDSSAHVAFYTFNPEGTEWEKTDVEGAFFVYTRNAEPYTSVFINNRLNTNSLVEPLTAGIELQNQTPFLLYRNERSRIRGFWFYNQTECDRLSKVIAHIIKEAAPLAESEENQENESSNIAPVQPFDFMPYANSNVDIFSMLTKAQQDFNKSLIPNVKGTPEQQQQLQQQQQQQQQILLQQQQQQQLQLQQQQQLQKLQQQQPKKVNNEVSEKKKVATATITPVATPQKSGPIKASPMQIPMPNNNGTSQSVMNFFAAAKPTTPGTEAPLMQRMMSQPIHIDQIEKRVKTPMKDKQPSPKQNQKQQLPPPQQQQSTYATGGKQNTENGLQFFQANSPTVDLGTSPLANFIASNNLAAMKPATDLKHLEAQQQQLKESLQLLKKPVPVINKGGAVVLSATTTPNKPALMPPTMFEPTATDATKTPISTSKTVKSEANESNKKSTVAKGKEQPAQSANKSRKKLLHEYQGQLKDELLTTVQPLTETQLLQALSYLMKNDPAFIKKIHEAYLKSFAEMVSQ